MIRIRLIMTENDSERGRRQILTLRCQRRRGEAGNTLPKLLAGRRSVSRLGVIFIAIWGNLYRDLGYKTGSSEPLGAGFLPSRVHDISSTLSDSMVAEPGWGGASPSSKPPF